MLELFLAVPVRMVATDFVVAKISDAADKQQLEAATSSGVLQILLSSLAELESIAALQRAHRALSTADCSVLFHARRLHAVVLNGEGCTVRVNWVELVMRDEAGSVTFRTAFITNHLITQENVEALVGAGRCRWNIENEDFNTLKTKGYRFGHNFGHGKRYLTQTLLSLNILAFPFPRVLELLDERCATLRRMLPRRDTLFQHIAALSRYLPFANWQSLLLFMIRALRDGPGPPPSIFPIRL